LLLDNSPKLLTTDSDFQLAVYSLIDRLLIVACRSRSHFTTDSMSWYRAPLWDLRPDIISCRNVAVWNLRSWSMVRVAQNPYHTLLSHLRLPQPGPPGSHIYIPQEQDGPVIPADTGFPLRHLLRLTGLRWRYSNFSLLYEYNLGTDCIENAMSCGFYIVACLFVAADMCLPHCCLAVSHMYSVFQPLCHNTHKFIAVKFSSILLSKSLTLTLSNTVIDTAWLINS
jgi:hypothetical protein